MEFPSRNTLICKYEDTTMSSSLRYACLPYFFELKGNESLDKGRLRIAQRTIVRDKAIQPAVCGGAAGEGRQVVNANVCVRQLALGHYALQSIYKW